MEEQLHEGSCRGEETRESTAVVQAGEGGHLDQSGGDGGGKKWADSKRSGRQWNRLRDGLAVEDGETRASRKTPLECGRIGWQAIPLE